MKHFFLRSLFISMLVFPGAVFFSRAAHADTYLKTRMMNGMMESESWTSGKKQRTVAQAPMVGEIVTIVRLDKGMEYQIAPSRKIYQEKPLALPYAPEPGETASAEDMRAFFARAGQGEAPDEKPCDPRIEKISGKRQIAGFDTTGYKAVCPGQEEGSTVWIAESSMPWSPLEAIRRETEEFQKAYMEAQYANYPKQEREELIKSMQALGSMMGQGMMGLPDMEKLPKGLPLAVETASAFMGGASEPGRKAVIFETLALNSEKIDPSLFEVPEGFTRVEDIHQAMAGDMFNQMGGGGFAGMLEQLQAQMPAEDLDGAESYGEEEVYEEDGNYEEENGMQDEEAAGDEETGEDETPAGMIRRPGPNGWIYEPASDAQDAASGQGTPLRRKPGPNGWIYEQAPAAGAGGLPQQVGQMAEQQTREIMQNLAGSALPGQMNQFASRLQETASQLGSYAPQGEDYESYDDSGDAY